MTLPRGFKARAERLAAELRQHLGRPPTAPVTHRDLADYANVTLVSADDIVDMARLEELERLQAFAFSAATFQIDGRRIVVTNPLRSNERLASDVAHEVAHIVLDHELAEVRTINNIPFHTCLPEEEEQATALGGTLLLPRELLLAAAVRGMSIEEIAEANGVTVDMARFRYNTTGVAKQARARNRS